MEQSHMIAPAFAAAPILSGCLLETEKRVLPESSYAESGNPMSAPALNDPAD